MKQMTNTASLFESMWTDNFGASDMIVEPEQ